MAFDHRGQPRKGAAFPPRGGHILYVFKLYSARENPRESGECVRNRLRTVSIMNAWWRAGPSKHGGQKWPFVLGFLAREQIKFLFHPFALMSEGCADHFVSGVMIPHPVASGMSGHFRPRKPKGQLALLREDSTHSIATRRRHPQESQNQAPCATQMTVDR